jgi:hypothetical protein
MFKEKSGYPIEEILKVIDLFPNKITEEMNKALLEKVSESKILDTLSTFQKYKSLGPGRYVCGILFGFL